MEIQRCRNGGVYTVGFMDPKVINQTLLQSNPKETFETIYRFLDKQHHMNEILLPYNFK
jgi:hypothetical protein